MQKTRTSDGYEFRPELKDYVRLVIIGVGLAGIGLFTATMTLSAIQPKQSAWESSVDRYNESVERLIQDRVEMLQAERDLAKEKIEEATTNEEWNEVERLRNKIWDIDGILEDRTNWKPFSRVRDNGSAQKKSLKS